MAVASGQIRSGGRPRLSTRWRAILLFIAPALALYAIFVILPIVQGAYYSLFKWNGFTALNGDNFIGLGNYQKALDNTVFQGAIKNNFLIVILSLLLQIPFSLSMAVYLNQRFPGRAFFRLIFFLPYVLSEVITAIVFYLLLQHNGLVNASLGAVGATGAQQTWLGDIHPVLALSGIHPWLPDISLVMLTLFFVISWKYFGFHMIILLAGLQGIPQEIYEAALIDGAGRWSAFRHVTLPLLGPTLRVSVFLSIVGALQIFDMVYALTRGGPVDTTQTMSTFTYLFGLRVNQMGYGSAACVILFLACLVFALLYQRYVLRRDVEGAITAYNG